MKIEGTVGSCNHHVSIVRNILDAAREQVSASGEELESAIEGEVRGYLTGLGKRNGTYRLDDPDNFANMARALVRQTIAADQGRLLNIGEPPEGDGVCRACGKYRRDITRRTGCRRGSRQYFAELRDKELKRREGLIQPPVIRSARIATRLKQDRSSHLKGVEAGLRAMVSGGSKNRW